MSDLYMYELEDNVWGEFDESDDHMVPYTGYEYANELGVQGHSQKKLRHVVDFASDADHATSHNSQKKEEASLSILTKKEIMLEKDSWSHSPNGAHHASCNGSSVKEVTSIATDKTRISSHYLKNGNTDSVHDECADAPTLDETCAAIDDNTYCYQLSHISQTDNDLSFLDNDHEEEEGTDLLYYEWPDDMGNFEDVDRMFRSCDSTFGLGSLNNADDLSWFSSSHSEGSEDALKLGSKLSSFEASALNSVSEHNEASRLHSQGHLVNNSNKKSLFIGDKISSRNTGDVDRFALDHLPYPNGLETKSTKWQKKQAGLENQSEEKRTDVNIENGSAFQHSGIQQHEQNMESSSLNYLQTHVPFIQMDQSSSDQISVCPTPSSKSENNGNPSPYSKESLYSSNPVQSSESSHNQAFSRNFKHASIASQMTFYDHVLKQTHPSENETEGNSEIEGVSIGNLAELDSSAGQEGSCMSSVLNEISLEATSFRQLQQVMEQLDIRTKLCIRDSLYRLARSAEQRHNCVNTNGGKRDDRDTNGVLMADETKGTGFMDMETDTNPIDRSIAHLLFHRPSDLSALPANDAVSLKPHPMN